MNSKKFISGVSAFAIAASAFAGMAVTANAADTYKIVFGNAVETDGVVTGVTPQTEFTTDNGTTESDIGSVNGYKLQGSYLWGNQVGGRTYNFDAPVSSGEVHFSTLAKYVGGNYDFWKIVANTSDDTTYDLVGSPYAITGTNNTSGNWVKTSILRVLGNSVESSTTSYKPRDQVFKHDVTISFTAKTITYSTSFASNGSSGKATVYTTDTNTVPLPENITSIVGLSMPRCGGSGGSQYDNVSLYAVIPSADAHVYTINAVDDGGAVIKQLATGTAEEGNPYGVNALPEVIEKDGAYYRLSTDVADRAVSYTMGTSDETKTVTYNADATIAYYIEGEDMTPSNPSNTSVYEDEAYSAGAARTMTGSNRNQYVNGVALESGKYTVIVGQGARKSSGSNPTSYTGAITIGDIAVGSMTGTMSGTLEQTFTDINIPEGTYTLKAAVTGNASSPVDYIIIVRTGDYTPAEASAVAAGDTFTTDEGDPAATFRFTVTPNDDTVTSIIVTAAGSNETSQTISTPTLSGDGSINCAIIATYKTAAPEASAFSVSIN